MAQINNVKYLYHGTNQEFDEFDFNKAKKYKDFGKGFYLTTNYIQAQRWAERKGKKDLRTYIYQYTIKTVDENVWKILELLKYDNQWVEFIAKSRIDGKETDYDIIYDRMADSRVEHISDTLQEYVNRKLSAEDVIKRIKWREERMTDQYCFKNKNALSLLERESTIVLQRDEERRWKVEERRR